MWRSRTYLIQVDNWLPEVVALLVEIPHSDLSKVTRMVLVHVRTVVVLSTSETSTTGMLAVLSYTTVTGGDVAATIQRPSAYTPKSDSYSMFRQASTAMSTALKTSRPTSCRLRLTYEGASQRA
jgi:hypothetical protein